MLRLIAMAAGAMNTLGRVWGQGRLRLSTKLRIYESCIVAVLLYCAETWTLLKADVDRLQAFHMRCLRRILGIRWQDHITNMAVKLRTCLEDIEPRLRRRRLALFGHIVRMSPGVPAHDALKIAVDVRCGWRPDQSWTRPRGHPRFTWVNQIQRDIGGMGLRDAWLLAADRVGWGAFATSL